MREGDVFGESALQGNTSIRMATVKADGPVTTLQLSRVRFIELLGDLTAVIRHNFNMKVLGGVEMFKALRPEEMETLVRALHEVTFEKGHRIIKQGEQGDSFYILKSGTVQVTIADAAGKETLVKDKMGGG